MQVLKETVVEEIEKLKKEGKTIQGARMILHEGFCPLARKIFGETINIQKKEDTDPNYICQCSCKVTKTSLLPYIEFETVKSKNSKIHCVAYVRYVSYDTRKYIENLLKPIIVY